MDWEGLKTAYLDRERARLGLPTREQEMEARLKREQQAALQASNLETADVTRDLTRAKLAALPAEQDLERRVREAQIRNYDEPNRVPSTAIPGGELGYLMSLDPAARAEAIKVKNSLRPSGGDGEPAQPKTGWQPQYDQQTGQLTGYYHPATATFRKVGEDNLPTGTRGAIPAGEMEKRGMLQSMLSDATYLQELVGSADKPTEAGQAIGYWTGRGNQIRSTGMFAPFGVEAPPENVLNMMHVANNISDMLLRARSGAQINEQEYQRLRKLMPDPSTAPETFRANLSRFIIETNNIMATRQGNPAAQPGMAPAAPAAPSGGVERWTRDASGKLVRAQ